MGGRGGMDRKAKTFIRRMNMSKELWLSRQAKHAGSLPGWYTLSSQEPRKYVGVFTSDGYIRGFCPEEFHATIKSIRLRPGQKVKLKEIKFVKARN